MSNSKVLTKKINYEIFRIGSLKKGALIKEFGRHKPSDKMNNDGSLKKEDLFVLSVVIG